jgi:hypothetical protein
MLAQTNKINTSNAVKGSVLAQFEWFHSCALFKNSKQLGRVEVLKTQIEWCYHEKLLDENSGIHDLCCDWSWFGRMLECSIKRPNVGH